MEVVNDFPAGAPRLVQKSKGSRMTLVNFNANVNGQVSVQDGEHTRMVGAKWGAIDSNGKMVLPAAYGRIRALELIRRK